MSDHWSDHPGQAPPATSSLPAGWAGPSTPPGLGAPPTFGVDPPLPPLPAPRPPSGNRNLVLAVSGLTVVLVAVLVGLLFMTRHDSSVAAGAGSTTSTKPSTTTTTVDDTPLPTTPGQVGPTTTTVPKDPVAPPVTRPGGVPPTLEQVQQAVDEITTFVEKQRGLTFKTKLDLDLVTDTDFAKQLDDELDKTKDDRVKTGRILLALGLIDRKLDYEATTRKLESIGVVAFYDADRRVLVIRAVQLTPYLKASLAREITRALDDASFRLARPQYATEQDEIAFGFRSVVEGDARRIEAAYIKTLSSPDQEQRKREANQFTADNPAPDVPAIVFDVVSAPADLGLPFVQKVVDHGGNDELASALKDPPRTSAQLLHADRWFAHDERVEVEKPKADGQVFAEGVFGEELTRLTLGNDADQQVADTAADGWAGDWYVAWDDGRGGSCIRINYKMNTPQDLTELEAAWKAFGEAHGGQTQAESTEAHDLLQVTSCSSSAGGGHNPA